jgi:hypothetical protein
MGKPAVYKEWLKFWTCIILANYLTYRVFHNVLHDYKHLKQENQRTYRNGIFHSHRKTEKFFWQLEMFNVCTAGDTARTCHHGDACVPRNWILYRCVPCHPWCTRQISKVEKKNFFSFPVAVKNSFKAGPLVSCYKCL